MNNELQKQLEQDLKGYGDKAYLLYEFQKDFYEDGVLVDQDWIPADSNYQVQEGLKFNCIRRKESAALPFDIERAKAGDAVEVLIGNEFKILFSENKGFKLNKSKTRVSVLRKTGSVLKYKIDQLKMKYPPRAKP